jgi:AcrR family transcriptional regulator
MGKGEETRDQILEAALKLASRVGLSGLTIGTLAEELELSKSGLFAHFGSKEALMIAVLEFAAERFTDVVVRPALAQPRGEARLRALLEGHRLWPVAVPQPGGCIFIASSVEFDDRPGPVHDRLRQLWQQWHDFAAESVRKAVDAGEFRADVDPDQFAFELDGIRLSWHHASRLLGDRKAGERASRAFEALVAQARVPGLPSPRDAGPGKRSGPAAERRRS